MENNRRLVALHRHLKIDARVVLATNIIVENQLINGQIGTVKYFEIKEKEIRTIYLKLDEKRAGHIRLSKVDVIAQNNKWVPVK